MQLQVILCTTTMKCVGCVSKSLDAPKLNNIVIVTNSSIFHLIRIDYIFSCYASPTCAHVK